MPSKTEEDDFTNNPFGKGLTIGTGKTAPVVEESDDEENNPFGKGLTIGKTVSGPKEKTAWEKYQELPWNEQLIQAVDDMMMLGASGLTYGAGEGLAKGVDNQQFLKEMEDRRQRAGLAGTGIELLGSVVSPITRGIVAGGNVLAQGAQAGLRAASPYVGRLANYASKAIPTVQMAGEGAAMGASGAALSGRPEDIGDEAALGAALPIGLKAGAKLLGPAVRAGQSYVTGVYPDVYKTAYTAGREGGIPQIGWKEGRKQGGGSQGYLNMLRKHAMQEGVDLAASVNLAPMAKRLKPHIESFRTSDKMKNMTEGELKKYNALADAYKTFRQYPSTIESVDAFKRNLDTWAYGKDDIAELAKAMQQELTFAAGAADPRYMKLAMDFDVAKQARTASASSKRMSSPSLTSVVTTLLGGGAGAMAGFVPAPIMMGAVPGLLAASSPRASTAIANALGKSRGLLDMMGIDPAKLGILEYQREKRAEREH